LSAILDALTSAGHACPMRASPDAFFVMMGIGSLRGARNAKPIALN